MKDFIGGCVIALIGIGVCIWVVGGWMWAIGGGR